jgi:beta-carotene ketolase (CrtW type)
MSVHAQAARPARRVAGQTAIGLSLAAALMAGWLGAHVYGVFLHRWTPADVVLAPLLILVQCWLNVGLFIVAHDCMHGSLAPGRPWLNRAVGHVVLALYAGFSFDRLIGKHHAHHRHSGTAEDPDFHADGPRAFWPWYVAFFRRYFGLREFAVLAALLATYLFVFRVDPANALVFWGVPAILSSLQLFYYGTYLPHRHESDAFSDSHNARSLELGPFASLVTCFHFGGYHHEHHEQPWMPWWRLPNARS